MRDTEIFPLRGEAHHPWHLYVAAVPDVKWYLGALPIPFTRYDGAQTEKTVLYFEAHAESRYANTDSDSDTKRWLSIEEARALLTEQPNGEQEILDRLRTTQK